MTDLLTAKRLVWGILLLLVTGVAGVSYFSGTRYLAAVRAVEETLELRAAIDGTLSLLTDAETAQRGYTLTGDDQFLEPFDAAQRGLPVQLAELRSIISGDAEQVAHLGRLDRLAQEKLDFMAENIRLHRGGNLDVALARTRSGQGRQLMVAIRGECQAMREREEARVRLRRSAAEQAKRLAIWGVGAGSLGTVFLALFSWLTVNRDVRQLRRTAGELARSEEH